MADLRLLTSNFLPMHGQSRVRGDLSRTFPRFRCTKLGGYSSGSVSALYISKVRLWEKNQSLESVPRPETTNDISSLGNLIKQYVDSGSPCDAVKVFVEMVECGVSLETFQFFPSLVKGFGDLSNVNKVREIHVYLLKLGFLEDVYVANSLLGAYWKSGGTEDAVQLFEKMPDKESVSWNTMISGFSRSGDHFRSLSTFRNMAGEYGVVPNRVACVSVITSCSALESLVHGREIHGFVSKNGFDDEFMVSGLMNMYMKCKDVKNARNVFKRVLGKEYVKVNTVIWNVMISGCVSNGYLPEALESLSEMLEIGVSLDSSTMVTVLDLCSELLDLEVGKQAHGLAVRFGIDKDVRVEANLVSMYFKCGDEKSGMDIFRRSPNRSKDSLWGSIILNCAQRGRPVEALNLFCSYRIENSFPDPAVTLAALRACSSSNTKSMGLEIHGLVLKSPAFGRDVYIGSALVDVYVKSGDIESAQKVFHNLPYRDLISWNALIVGYAQNGCPEEALRAFRDMQNEKIRPNTVAISCVLTVCSSLSAMALCKEIHGYVFRRSFRSNVLINNSLTSTYAKCGDIQSSLTVFRRMPKRDKVSLNSILLGLSMHGRAGEIIPLFEEAVMSGTKPDHATFSALLSACSHTGRLEEGFEYFKKMVEYYKIEPRIEQFSGMVDLLGRAGNLKQAHDLILAMPCAPDERIWGSLLSSCKIHGDKELATIVADRIMELNPTNISYRILLSNLYEDHGESSEAGRVRSEIKDMGLKKSPGCSWIEVDNNLHTFIASDRSHYRLADIYSALDSLTEQIRAVR